MHIEKLPANGYLRASQLIGSKKTTPPTAGIIPICHSTLWRFVREGTFPAPVKLGVRVTAWRVQDVREWMLARDAASAKAVH